MDRCCASKSKYSPTASRPMKSRLRNGRKGWSKGEPYSCTSGIGEEVKCARIAGVDALEVKAEIRERMEERIAGRGVGILFLASQVLYSLLFVCVFLIYYGIARTMHWAMLRFFDALTEV